MTRHQPNAVELNSKIFWNSDKKNSGCYLPILEIVVGTYDLNFIFSEHNIIVIDDIYTVF